MKMVLDEVSKGGGGEIFLSARLICLILVAYVEPNTVFLDFLAGNSPVPCVACVIAILDPLDLACIALFSLCVFIEGGKRVVHE
jgi:hypothetical protein